MVALILLYAFHAISVISAKDTAQPSATHEFGILSITALHSGWVLRAAFSMRCFAATSREALLYSVLAIAGGICRVFGTGIVAVVFVHSQLAVMFVCCAVLEAAHHTIMILTEAAIT